MTRPGPARGAGLAAVILLVTAVLVIVGASSTLLRGGVVGMWDRPTPDAPAATASAPAVQPGPAAQPGPTAAPGPTMTRRTALVAIGAEPAGHRSADAVVDLLDRHFSAINERDHAGWAATVETRRDLPADQWQRAFRSTTDSAVEVHSIAEVSGGVLVGLQFVSEQQPADAPPELPVSRICWTVSWPVLELGSGGRIGTPERGSTGRQAC